MIAGKLSVFCSGVEYMERLWTSPCFENFCSFVLLSHLLYLVFGLLVPGALFSFQWLS